MARAAHLPSRAGAAGLARWRSDRRVAEVKGGNEKAMNWFTGQAMKASQGKANPKMVTEIVRKKVLG